MHSKTAEVRLCANEGPGPAIPSTIRLNQAWRAVILLSTLAAYSIPITLFYQLFPLVSRMPAWDQWHLIPIWETYFAGGSISRMMFQPYAGHLNILPRFVFIGLGLVSHWNIRWEIIASYVVATATLTILLQSLRQTDRRLLVLAAPISAQVFSLLQFENFMTGYPLGQNISQFAATAAIYCATKNTIRTRDVLLTATASFTATFSWGAGLVAWPVSTLAILFAPITKKIWIIGLTAATATVATVVRLAEPARPSFNLGKIASFFLILLGKPVSIVPFPTANECLARGVSVIIALSVLFTAVLLLRLFDVAWRWGAFALLSLSSALLISIGRFEDDGPQALASHYVTATYLAVVAAMVMGAALLLHEYDFSHTRFVRLVTVSALAFLASAVFFQPLLVVHRMLPTLRAWAAITRENNRKLISGVATDEDIHRLTHPDANLVRRGLRVLRQNRLAAFRGRARAAEEPNHLPLPAQAFQLQWHDFSAPAEVERGRLLSVRVGVMNCGPSIWPASVEDGDYPVRLGYRWSGTSEPDGSYDGHRINLPRPVRPNESVVCEFDVEPPETPGDYFLQLNLVQEHVAWFQDKGCKSLEHRVRVVAHRE